MTPKFYLATAGILLIIAAIVGYASPDVFQNGTLVLSAMQNMLHLVLGIVAVGLSLIPWGGKVMRASTIAFAVVALFFGVMGFVWSQNPDNVFHAAHLDDPIDNVLYLVLAVWGFASAFTKRTGVEVDIDHTPRTMHRATTI